MSGSYKTFGDLFEELHWQVKAPKTGTVQRNGYGRRARGPAPAVPDDVVLEKIRTSREVDLFRDLFDKGSLAHHDGDATRADWKLLMMLRFYTQDPEQIARLMARSALDRVRHHEAHSAGQTRIEYSIERVLEGDFDTYEWPKDRDGAGPSSSSLPLREYDEGDAGSQPLELVSFASVERPPDEREQIVERILPERYPSILFGDGGTAKSLLAASLGLQIARGAATWLGYRILKTGPVIYFDFELDLTEQARRVYQLAEGVGLEEPPEDFYYLSGAGVAVGKALTSALELAKNAGAVLVILDSLGYALEGDAEAYRDVMSFIRRYMKPFENAGIAILMVDHQSKVSAGESYHQKTPFGSVYKSNSCRSVIQVGLEDQRDGEVTVRFRHKKANFAGRFEPFEAVITFHETRVVITHGALGAEDVAQEGSMNTAQKARRLLEKRGPMFPDELAEGAGVQLGTMHNALTKLRRRGEVEYTGLTNATKAHQVRIRPRAPSSSSQPIRDDDDDDDGGGADGGARDPRQTTIDEFLEGAVEGML